MKAWTSDVVASDVTAEAPVGDAGESSKRRQRRDQSIVTPRLRTADSGVTKHRTGRTVRTGPKYRCNRYK